MVVTEGARSHLALETELPQFIHKYIVRPVYLEDSSTRQRSKERTLLKCLMLVWKRAGNGTPTLRNFSKCTRRISCEVTTEAKFSE